MDSHLSNLEENTSLLSNESQVETKSSINSFFFSKKIIATFALACLGILAVATFSSRPVQSGVGATTLWTKNSGYMCEGGRFNENDRLNSPNGDYYVIFQDDGNFVVYKNVNNKGDKALWSTSTSVNNGYVAFQNDGNLVVYNKNNNGKWNSGTVGIDKYSVLKIQNDGNLVIYNPQGQSLWSSGSSQGNVAQNDGFLMCSPAPTSAPVTNPTSAPIANPTRAPTSAPVTNPTSAPIANPTRAPTSAPVANPTQSPTPLYVPVLTGGSTITSTKSNNNGGLQFLDRHNVDCASKPLQQFVGFNDGGSFRYNYECNNVKNGPNPSSYSDTTSYVSQGDTSLANLQTSNVDCDGNSLLSQFGLMTGNNKKLGNYFYYSYTCVSFGISLTCRSATTSWNSQGSIVFLDRQNVGCKDNEGLQQFQLNYDSKSNNIDYSYTCCTFNAPTLAPTAYPIANPTYNPTAYPIANPTYNPTAYPIANPTDKPTKAPIAEPSEKPIANPTDKPTKAPIAEPSEKPIAEPTDKPTKAPIAEPSEKPIAEPTYKPTKAPIAEPSDEPTPSPSDAPTIDDTVAKELACGSMGCGSQPESHDDGSNGGGNAAPSAVCVSTFTKGVSPESAPAGCGFVFSNDIAFMKDGTTSPQITVCATKGSDVKLDASDLKGYGITDNPKPVFGVSALDAASDSDFEYFIGSSFSGLSSRFSSYKDGSLTSKVYPGSRTSANDNVNSIIFSTSNEAEVTQTC